MQCLFPRPASRKRRFTTKTLFPDGLRNFRRLGYGNDIRDGSAGWPPGEPSGPGRRGKLIAFQPRRPRPARQLKSELMANSVAGPLALPDACRHALLDDALPMFQSLERDIAEFPSFHAWWGAEAFPHGTNAEEVLGGVRRRFEKNLHLLGIVRHGDSRRVAYVVIRKRFLSRLVTACRIAGQQLDKWAMPHGVTTSTLAVREPDCRWLFAVFDIASANPAGDMPCVKAGYRSPTGGILTLKGALQIADANDIERRDAESTKGTWFHCGEAIRACIVAIRRLTAGPAPGKEQELAISKNQRNQLAYYADEFDRAAKEFPDYRGRFEVLPHGPRTTWHEIRRFDDGKEYLVDARTDAAVSPIESERQREVCELRIRAECRFLDLANELEPLLEEIGIVLPKPEGSNSAGRVALWATGPVPESHISGLVVDCMFAVVARRLRRLASRNDFAGSASGHAKGGKPGQKVSEDERYLREQCALAWDEWTTLEQDAGRRPRANAKFEEWLIESPYEVGKLSAREVLKKAQLHRRHA